MGFLSFFKKRSVYHTLTDFGKAFQSLTGQKQNTASALEVLMVLTC